MSCGNTNITWKFNLEFQEIENEMVISSRSINVRKGISMRKVGRQRHE